MFIEVFNPFGMTMCREIGRGSDHAHCGVTDTAGFECAVLHLTHANSYIKPLRNQFYMTSLQNHADGHLRIGFEETANEVREMTRPKISGDGHA